MSIIRYTEVSPLGTAFSPSGSSPGEGDLFYNVNTGTLNFQKGSASPVDIEAGGGAVSSVFTRTGAVVSATNDYTWGQVDKATSDLADITTRAHSSLSPIGASDHHSPVTVAGTPDYLTLAGQVLTRTKLDISDDTNLVAGTALKLTANTLDVSPASIATSTLNNDSSWAADQNLFASVLVDAQSPLEAESPLAIARIAAGANVTLTASPASNRVTIAAGSPGSGEANTASSQGAGGVGVVSGKVGVDLQFRSINAGSTKVKVTFDSPNKEVDIDVSPANIDHDVLTNFVANEHIDHSGVSVIAGTHLTGGGTLEANRTLNVSPEGIDHNVLTNWSSPKHIDHSAVSVIAGTLLSGGGTIDGNVTLNVDAHTHTSPGTGGTVAHSALTGVGATDHHSPVTVAGTPDYATLAGQVLTLGTVDIGDDTNLTATSPLSLSGDTLSVQDVFLKNDGDVGTGAFDFGGATSLELPNSAGGGTLDADGEVGVDTSPPGTLATLNFYASPTEYVLHPEWGKGITIPDPVAADSFKMFYTRQPITVTHVYGFQTGGTSVTGLQIKHHADRDNAGNSLFSPTEGVTDTSGEELASPGVYNDPTIPANSWVWVTYTTVTGDVTELGLDLFYTVDP